MEVATFVRGVAIGAAVAAPVGPMSLLCMRRTLASGWAAGLRTGLGIATGDAVYAAVAALGLASVSAFMLAHEKPLHALAGAMLLALGLRSFARRSPDPAASPVRSTGGYASAVVLTLTNPPTIVSFAAIFTVIAPTATTGVASSAALVAGVFAGSAFWWLLLTASVALLRRVVGAPARRALDALSSGALAFLGIAELRRSIESPRSRVRFASVPRHCCRNVVRAASFGTYGLREGAHGIGASFPAEVSAVAGAMGEDRAPLRKEILKRCERFRRDRQGRGGATRSELPRKIGDDLGDAVVARTPTARSKGAMHRSTCASAAGALRRRCHRAVAV